MVENLIFDMRLPRAMAAGVDSLPGDLRVLKDYLELIQALLGEKAREYEPTWEQAICAGVETSDLHRLEEAVAERAARVRAELLHAVLEKLAIWRAIHACEDECDLADGPSIRDRLVLSIEADIARLSRRERAS